MQGRQRQNTKVASDLFHPTAEGMLVFLKQNTEESTVLYNHTEKDTLGD